MKKLTLAWLLAGVVVVGCGGGGGSSSGGPKPGGAQVAMFITDAPISSFSQVWVRILKAELVGPDGAVTVYESADGNVVDLASLDDNGQSQFALLGITNVPAGNYASVRFTLDDDVSLIPLGGGTAQPRKFDGSADGLKVLSFELKNAVQGQTNIVADFDLANWNEDGTFVYAVVKQGDDDGLNDDANHVSEQYEGTIGGLTGTAPNYSFDLQRGAWTLRIATDETTSVFNSDGSPNPTIGNGSRVHVTGTYDAATRTVKATSIKIQKGNGNKDEAEAQGAVTAESANGFTISVSEAEGFIPGASTVDVTVTAATRYFSHGGLALTKDEFFTALAVGGFAEAEGAYDAATNTITATKVKLEDGDDDHGGGGHEAEAEVKGAISDLDTTARTFKVTIREWEGIPLSAGAVVSVTVNAGTEYRGRKGGDRLNADQFFAAIANGATVSVRGAYDADSKTLLADRLRLRDGGGDDDDDGGDDNGGGGDD